ncbi:hypothetical protein Tco_1409252, partial [Tanacetum coccineum]
SYALSWKPCQGDSLNLPDHRYKRWCCSLIPAESDSLPYTHAQTTKTYHKHQDSRIKKAQEMGNPDITMEEYIQLEAEKAHRRGQEFNWETATYGKVMYFEDIDYFKDFENEFPAIVYEDALTSEPEDSSEPTVSSHHVEKVDLDFVISFDEFDDKDYTFTYDKNSFSYKLVFVNDLKLDLDNDDDKIDIKQSSGDISVKLLPDVISIDT